jgi:Rrf2 family nitric oxide-sensitive transcriptional repressor
VRGKGGGLELARARRTSASAPWCARPRAPTCRPSASTASTTAAVITRICRLKGVLREATAAFHAVLDRYTLADLVQNPQALARMLMS